MFSFALQKLITSNKHAVHCMLKFDMSSELAGSDLSHLSDKRMFIYYHVSL
jgi:hypothetical protein